MKTTTKRIRIERLRDGIRQKAIAEAQRTLDDLFPTGKRRSEAMAVFAVAFNEGFKAGEEFQEIKPKRSKE